ncbi:MAG: hypothetical protein M9938_09120 [Solirubrobacterales bacterium]|nr:hypothetical protein [Solirubrobacterales bacterium]
MCEGGVVMMRRSPLVRFSHACTPDRAVYTSLVCRPGQPGLFTVASVDHTSDAFTVEFPGGELVDGQFGTPLESKQISEPELVNLVNVRTRELPAGQVLPLVRKCPSAGNWPGAHRSEAPHLQ